MKSPNNYVCERCGYETYIFEGSTNLKQEDSNQCPKCLGVLRKK
jgi:DNA-directed RNA polymerase subunit RPC12/RpoP